MASPLSAHHPRRPAGSADGGRDHRFRTRKRVPSSSAGPPDLATAAREAVVGFLHDSSMGPAQAATGQAGVTINPEAGSATVTLEAPAHDAAAGLSAPIRVGIPAGLTPGVGGVTADSVAMRAAAMGVATLDRIEAAAAKVEADIRAALQAQAELRAGAGAAAEAAVRAAEDSWIAAHKSEAAEGRARVILGLMTRYLAVTIALVVITIIFLIITASTAH